MKYLVPVPSDIDISRRHAQADHPRGPPGRHHASGTGALRQRRGQGPPQPPGTAGRGAQRQVHRRDGHHPHPTGRGQDDHLGWTDAGTGQAQEARLPVHPPAVDGADFRHQGRGRRRRLQPGNTHGGVQPSPYRRHTRRLDRQQPAGCRHRRPHEARDPCGRGVGPQRPQAHRHRSRDRYLAAHGQRKRRGFAVHRDGPQRQLAGRAEAAHGLRHRRCLGGHGHPARCPATSRTWRLPGGSSSPWTRAATR